MTPPDQPGALAGIRWLGDAGPSQDPKVVGGKAANLSRLAARFTVPPGFCVAGTETEPPADDAILAAYRALSRRRGAETVPVAVRSSAVDEDGTETSFAGQNETYLNVRGTSAVFEAVRKCVASFETERTRAYRQQHGLSDRPARHAVLVQELVVADVSGVAFSADPVSRDRDTVVVNASWGLGESIVGGTVSPDTFRVDRGRTDIATTAADKQRMTVATAGGTAEVGVPSRLRLAPCLHPAQVTATATLAVELEQAMGWPVDAEFAWAADELNLLQCRPVTTLHAAVVGGNENEDQA